MVCGLWLPTTSVFCANSMAQTKLMGSNILTSALISGFNSLMKFPKATSSRHSTMVLIIQ